MYSAAEQKIRLERWSALTAMQRSLSESDEHIAEIFEEYDQIMLPAEITNALSVRNDISHNVTDIIQQLLDPGYLVESGSPLLERLDRLMDAFSKISFALVNFLVGNENQEPYAAI